MRAKWTDLAVEAAGGELREGGLSRTVVKVEDEASARRLGRPMGTYVTLACEQALTVSLETQRVLVTRHIGDSLPWGAEMNSVCAAAPGVLGVTGMETAEILRGMVAHVRPDAVIAVDALAARSSKRIASTIQIADTGITPGSGVGNHRKALDRETLGVPVVAVGVPLVVYASTIAADALCALGEGEVEEERIAACVERVVSEKLGEMIVTPREVDALVEGIERVAKMF